jgi:OOP family OmpA-OmpF porin
MRWRVIAVTTLGAALVIGLGTGPPSRAGDQPNVPDDELAKAVRTIQVDKAVRDILTSKAVEALETEETSGDQITLRISADVLFDFDKAALTSAAKRRLERLAPRLRGVTGTIQVSGHTNAKGDPASNRRLSEQRARAIVEWLATQGGIDRSRLKATGYGETKPVAANTTPNGADNSQGRAKNRRVVISAEQS